MTEVGKDAPVWLDGRVEATLGCQHATKVSIAGGEERCKPPLVTCFTSNQQLYLSTTIVVEAFCDLFHEQK